MDKEIQSIIFDFGGVLIDLDYEKTTDEFEKLGGRDFTKKFSQLNQTQIFNQYETGKISTSRFVNELLSQLEPGVTANAVIEAWNAMLLEISIENVLLLARLKPYYNLYLLSNTNEVHIKMAFNRWEESNLPSPYDLFDKVYLSHEIGMRKPNKEIFEFVCQDSKLIPEQTLFIDDSAQHIKGAEEYGLKTYHLKDIKALYKAFPDTIQQVVL